MTENLDFVQAIMEDPEGNTAFVLTDGMRAVEIAYLIQEISEELEKECSIYMDYSDVKYRKTQNFVPPTGPVNLLKHELKSPVNIIKLESLKSYYPSVEDFEKDCGTIREKVRGDLS